MRREGTRHARHVALILVVVRMVIAGLAAVARADAATFVSLVVT